jgi:hypothetical protein
MGDYINDILNVSPSGLRASAQDLLGSVQELDQFLPMPMVSFHKTSPEVQDAVQRLYSKLVSDKNQLVYNVREMARCFSKAADTYEQADQSLSQAMGGKAATR